MRAGRAPHGKLRPRATGVSGEPKRRRVGEYSSAFELDHLQRLAARRQRARRRTDRREKRGLRARRELELARSDRERTAREVAVVDANATACA